MENKELHIHQFSDTVIPSTCKECGYTLHKCECGYEHKDSFKPLTPHTYETVERKTPTCTQSGMVKQRCTVCAETQEAEISPLGHDWGEWSVIEFATCTRDGKRIRVCRRCNESEEDIIKTTGHKLSSPRKSETEKGVVEYFCENCGETVKKKASSHKIKKFFKIFIPTVIILAIVVFAVIKFGIPGFHYLYGKKLMTDGDYTNAYNHLIECRDFRDTEELLKDFTVVYLESTYTNTNYNSDGEITGKSEHKSECRYDENGTILYRDTFDEDGNLTYNYERFTIIDSDEEKVISTNYDINGNVTSINEYYYDKDGNKILEIPYDKNGDVCYKYVFEYDENGNNIKSIYYNKSGLIEHYYIYKYDKYGNMTKSTNYDENGNEKYSTKYNYNYDKDGNVTTKFQYDSSGELVYKIEYEYDENGNRIKLVYYDEDGNLDSKYEYDEHGNITFCAWYYSDGEISFKCEYEYSDPMVIYNPQ